MYCIAYILHARVMQYARVSTKHAYQLLSTASIQDNECNATDVTYATTDEATDCTFDTPSFEINTQLLGICFSFKYTAICDLFLFIYCIRSR